LQVLVDLEGEVGKLNPSSEVWTKIRTTTYEVLDCKRGGTPVCGYQDGELGTFGLSCYNRQ